jgi:hypothetical protein
MMTVDQTETSIDAQYEEVLAPLLTLKETSFSAARKGGFRSAVSARPLYRVEAGGRLIFPSNLFRLVAHNLRQHKLEVQVVIRRKWPARFAQINPGVLKGLAPTMKDLMEWCLGLRCGLVRLDGRLKPLTVITLLCRLYPAVRIVVALPTRRAQDHYYAALRRNLVHDGRKRASIRGRNCVSSPVCAKSCLMRWRRSHAREGRQSHYHRTTATDSG